VDLRTAASPLPAFSWEFFKLAYLWNNEVMTKSPSVTPENSFREDLRRICVDLSAADITSVWSTGREGQAGPSVSRAPQRAPVGKVVAPRGKLLPAVSGKCIVTMMYIKTVTSVWDCLSMRDEYPGVYFFSPLCSLFLFLGLSALVQTMYSILL